MTHPKFGLLRSTLNHEHIDHEVLYRLLWEMWRDDPARYREEIKPYLMGFDLGLVHHDLTLRTHEAKITRLKQLYPQQTRFAFDLRQNCALWPDVSFLYDNTLRIEKLEWFASWSIPAADLFEHLNQMPHLRHLPILRGWPETFEVLRDTPLQIQHLAFYDGLLDMGEADIFVTQLEQGASLELISLRVEDRLLANLYEHCEQITLNRVRAHNRWDFNLDLGRHHPKLKRLSFEECTEIETQLCQQLTDALPQLEHLEISGTSFDVRDFDDLFSMGAPNLHTLKLTSLLFDRAFCQRLCDAPLPRLRHLFLGELYSPTEEPQHAVIDDEVFEVLWSSKLFERLERFEHELYEYD